MDRGEYIGGSISLMMRTGDKTETEAIKFAANPIRNAGFKAVERAPASSKLVPVRFWRAGSLIPLPDILVS